MSDWSYITAAYAATWVVILGYAIYLSTRRRALARAAAERLDLEQPFRGEP